MLNDPEKTAIRYHLGYLNITTPLAIALGFPTASHLQFIVESAMNSVILSAEPRVRRCIQELDCIEDQQSTFRTSLEVVKSGTTTIRGPDAFAELDQQYRRWSQRLADLLGTPLNPFSAQHQDLETQGGGQVIEPG